MNTHNNPESIQAYEATFSPVAELLVCFFFAWLIALAIFISKGTNIIFAIEVSFQILVTPITALAWFKVSYIVTPLFILLITLSLFIKWKMVRRISLQALAILWNFFGFICAAIAY